MQCALTEASDNARMKSCLEQSLDTANNNEDGGRSEDNGHDMGDDEYDGRRMEAMVIARIVMMRMISW